MGVWMFIDTRACIRNDSLGLCMQFLILHQGKQFTE